MSTYRTVGSKYQGFRPSVEIAKDIRRDIKAAVRNGSLPSDLKVSVRSRYYAGGQSIDIAWSATRGTHELWCSRHQARWIGWCENTDCDGTYLHVGLSTLGRDIEDNLRSIADAYNYDNSDPMVDYFDTLFYCHPQWNWGVRVKASNLVGLDPKVAETFATLHLIDHVKASDALQMARKLVNA